MKPQLEVCVGSTADIEAAAAGGADRVELCAATSVGGLTPSAAAIAAAVLGSCPVHVLIRPREGGFTYDDQDAALIADDIARALDLGAAGVVIGAGLPDGRLDLARLEDWIGLARRINSAADVTLHRAFDLCPDLHQALEEAASLGFNRILTSGGRPRAPDAVSALAALHKQADGRLTVMPGGGVNATNVAPLLAGGLTAFHASCSEPVGAEGQNSRLLEFGFVSPTTRRTAVAQVAALRQALNGRDK
ncbi:copper homeostasis protein CutC [Brevundimonas sp. SL130]|uniref:copper homeostasis protein CutC n=1 Tax=Brevundimonas sp. SL130 TaxID=2995143 RepID=UPI00226CBC95|nr:copper homeostasis protein CutC [Brevundimonas sp. SL130]WAC58334.1 copper homeostasis protein CutC [Brevundimonas sp. SL130]